MPLTEEQYVRLHQARQLVKDVSEGEWKFSVDYLYTPATPNEGAYLYLYSVPPYGPVVIDVVSVDEATMIMRKKDAEFIEASPTIVRNLISIIDTLLGA